MDKLLKWEQKRIVAMLLAAVMLFNAITSIEMQNVYAAEDVVEEVDVAASADAGGTTDGNEGDDIVSATDGDVSGGSENVTDGDVSGDISGELVSIGDVSGVDSNIVVAASQETMPNTPEFDGVVTYYRAVNGSNNIRVSGSVKCFYEVEQVKWSTSPFTTDNINYNMNQGTSININQTGSIYSFSFDGNISGNLIYICAQSKTNSVVKKAYEQKVINLSNDDEEDDGDGLIEDTSAPNIKRLSVSENFKNKDSGNYFSGTISLGIANVTNADDVKQYVIKEEISVDEENKRYDPLDNVVYNGTTIEIRELTRLSNLYIFAEDILGNISSKSLKEVVKREEEDDEGDMVWSTFLKTNAFIIDSLPPVITFRANDGTIIEPSNGVTYEWRSDWTSVTYEVAESGTQFEHVKVKVNSSDFVEVNCENNEVKETIDLVDGVNKIIVEAKDYAGHITTSQMIVGIDRQAPMITSCSLAPADPKNRLNMLSFGNFANADVKVSVTAKDENNGSDQCAGVKAIKVYVGGSLAGTKLTLGKDSEQITIPLNLFSDKTKKIVTVSAVDNSDLESTPIPINQITSTTVSSDKMLIETEKPIARLDMENAFAQSDSRKVVGKTFEITAGGEDAHSGIYSYQIVYKDEQNSVSENVLITEEKKSVSENVVVSVDELGDVTGNTIKIEVTAHDNAGNVSDVKAQEFFIDKKAPEAKKFVIIAGGETEEAEIISSGDYGYFFNEEVEVRLYFDDGVVGETSGVKTITCYTIDSERKRVDREVSVVKSEPAGNTSSKTTDKDISDGDTSDGDVPNEKEDSAHNYYYATIKIEDGFKGHIYASATDYADNAMDSYASTKGVVVETMSRHETEQHVVIDLPKSPAKDDEGNNLYAGNVTIPVTIIDTMSGINSIWWEVKAPQDTEQNYTGSISIGDIVEDVNKYGDDSEWTIEGHKNLVYKVKKDFVVSNNSNGIEISIYMMDNAGNVIKEDENGKATISIDKTKPTIEISFDNNDPDDVYTDMYSEDRTATITVKERNFSSDKISVDIANSIGGTPSVSGWSSSKNTENPDESTHTATVTFSEDGEYTMNVSGEDAVGNDADSKSIDPFILDKTLPKLEVSYSNNNVRNGNYYADARTVIVTVTERNFAPERVRLAGTVIGSGQTRSFPVLSSFTQRGDVYTATALCQDDGLYSFTVEYSDKAGNQGQTHTAEAYHIDKTAPVISFASVEPNSANNGDLMPQVVMTDNNFNKSGVDIRLVGANNGLVDLGGTFANLTNGQAFTYYNFPKEVEYDDLYTINVEVSDLAGNVTDSDITFSVNRFGSVYVFDQNLKDIAGTYINNPVEVSLTEVNIDSLEHDTIKVVMDYNGTSRDLVEGDDYEVKQVRGEGSWYRYNYSIDDSLFVGDGRYIVALYSVDRAGNINQNTDETKKAEISFGVDKTAPVVIPIDLEENKQYAVDIKTATITVNDNLLLKDVAIFVNGNKCEYTNNGENYVFNIPNSKTKQQITVLATDMAGNVTEHIIGGVLVNTNLFIRWYNNRPLFIGTLLALAALCGGGVVFLAVYRRRKYEN